MSGLSASSVSCCWESWASIFSRSLNASLDANCFLTTAFCSFATWRRDLKDLTVLLSAFLSFVSDSTWLSKTSLFSTCALLDVVICSYISAAPRLALRASSWALFNCFVICLTSSVFVDNSVDSRSCKKKKARCGIVWMILKIICFALVRQLLKKT